MIKLLESKKNSGTPIFQRIARAISWLSLELTFRPTGAGLTAIHTAMPPNSGLDQKLDYNFRYPGIIPYVGAAEDRVRITLDPVFELLGVGKVQARVSIAAL